MYSSAVEYMMSAVRSMVALRRSAMTSMTARCVSRDEISRACALMASLISTWWLQRLMSWSEGGVEIVSTVRLRPTVCVASARVSSMCTRYFSATLRLTLAVTLGLPSRSEPIQLPGWKNAGQTGGTVPAFSPSSQSLKRR